MGDSSCPACASDGWLPASGPAAHLELSCTAQLQLLICSPNRMNTRLQHGLRGRPHKHPLSTACFNC